MRPRSTGRAPARARRHGGCAERSCELPRRVQGSARPHPDGCSSVKHSAHAPTQRTGSRTRASRSPEIHRMSTLNTTASYEEARTRRVNRLPRRERAVEATVGGAFVVAALALVLLGDGGRPFRWGDAAIAVVALGAASMVVFEVGSTYTMPVQLAFVPMLFVLPAPAVPLCVAVALMLPKLGDALLGRRPIGRSFMAFGDSWFALAPALIFMVAGLGAPDGHDWPLYLAAL